MNTLSHVRHALLACIQNLFGLDESQMASIELQLNVDKDRSFGDLSCNAAMVLAKHLKQNPRGVAQQIQDKAQELSLDTFGKIFESVEIAGPGFLNVTLVPAVWFAIARELFSDSKGYFQHDESEKKLRYSIEFVSANPTGPLHLGAGRNGIIGDVLSRVLSFLGHDVHKEYYVNDAGNQIKKLGASLRARCLQELGDQEELPEGGYVGEYLIDVAKQCVAEYGDALRDKDADFFAMYAKEKLLEIIKKDLEGYGITFDSWVSEKKLHDDGSVVKSLELLKSKKLAYEKDGAVWFKATEFGDDKDRVIQKSTGEMTYIAGDIAYHRDKFDRGYDKVIDVLGQDHHGYVMRLKATMQALGFDTDKLDVILYQLVSIKEKGLPVKMSKRAGTFTKLSDLVAEVGIDVARFFYLNRKAEAHLEFDLAVALKKTQENPVFYIQYAYVRTNSLLAKAAELEEFKAYVDQLKAGSIEGIQDVVEQMEPVEIDVLKKIVSLHDVLRSIATSNQTHMLAYYSWELANKFHNFYTNNRIIDISNVSTTQKRLLLAVLVHNALNVCLKLLGVSRPEKM